MRIDDDQAHRKRNNAVFFGDVGGYIDGQNRGVNFVAGGSLTCGGAVAVGLRREDDAFQME